MYFTIYQCVYFSGPPPHVYICPTDKATQALDKHGRCGAQVLERLAVQSQQVQAEVYRSLQRMRLQRAQLQAGLRQHAETRADHNELDHNGVRYTFTPVYSESGNLS